MKSHHFNQLDIEIRDGNRWRAVGHVKLIGHEDDGLNASTEFCYDLDYASDYSERNDFRAVSCLAPVTFEPISYAGWPPFLLDLFPQGAALRYIVDHYRISDLPKNYWKIIKTARLNPPGNLRAVIFGDDRNENLTVHPGFKRQDVLAKGADFLEYMVEQGAPVAGTTGAGGAAPKFLLREDYKGRFHADGTLPDSKTKCCWLVKFPRGRSRDDRDILSTEKSYGAIAKWMGLMVHGRALWESNCLFVPRFDRKIIKKSIRHFGLESFYSLVGLPEFGSRLEHETYLKALAQFSSKPEHDIIEYVLRDFLNLMLGNTDNHGRNTSLIKGSGTVRLAPVYDFAPMKFDPDGIVRNTRWSQKTGDGNIAAICQYLVNDLNVNQRNLDKAINQFFAKASSLEAKMQSLKVPKRYIEATAQERRELLNKIARYINPKSRAGSRR